MVAAAEGPPPLLAHRLCQIVWVLAVEEELLVSTKLWMLVEEEVVVPDLTLRLLHSKAVQAAEVLATGYLPCSVPLAGNRQ